MTNPLAVTEEMLEIADRLETETRTIALSHRIRRWADQLTVAIAIGEHKPQVSGQDARLDQIKAALAVEWRLKTLEGIHHDHLSDLAYLIATLEYWQARAAIAETPSQQGDVPPLAIDDAGTCGRRMANVISNAVYGPRGEGR